MVYCTCLCVFRNMSLTPTSHVFLSELRACSLISLCVCWGWQGEGWVDMDGKISLITLGCTARDPNYTRFLHTTQVACQLPRFMSRQETAANPGFSGGGGANLLFGQASPKMHENEENWTGSVRLKFYYIRHWGVRRDNNLTVSWLALYRADSFRLPKVAKDWPCTICPIVLPER